jgi:hypothetical protein
VVINQTFANRYWPNQDPTGKRLVFGSPGPNNPWITIVGVVADLHRRGLHRGARLETFHPSGQRGGGSMQLLVAANGAPLTLAPAVRAEIRALDPSGPITEVGTVEAEIGESLAVRRFQALLLSLFSLLAVLLAAVGAFGLMGQLVVRRRPEIGLRMALGATPHGVMKMILRHGLLLAAAGGVVGIGGRIRHGQGPQESLVRGKRGRSNQLCRRGRCYGSRDLARLQPARMEGGPHRSYGGVA